MKLNMIKQIAAGLGVLSFAVVLYSCEADWEKDYKAVTLKAPATATVSVTSIADSTALLNYSLSVTGRLYVAVVPGTDETPAPDAQAILKQTVGGAVFSKQIILNDAGALSSSVIVSGLVQNTSYKVFALPVNDDGVLGEIVTTEAFSTSDHHAPVLDLDSGVSPAITGNASIDLNFKPVLTFDEPVVLAETFSIKMGYRNVVTAEIVWVDVPKDSITISGSKVTIAQPATAMNGQYVFLSIGNGSVKDRAGNSYEGVTSGIVGGYLEGIYWRIKFSPTATQQILPADSVTSDVSMKITLDYPIKMRFPTSGEGGYVQGNVVVRYYTSTTTLDVQVPQANVAVVKDTLVQITLPRTPVYGETVTLKMTEGVMRNAYGNPSKAIAFGDKEWFISYGYTRNMVIGNYVIGNLVSQFSGPITDEYNVITSAHPTDPNLVVISGLLGSEDDIVAEFNGDFASFNIPTYDGMGQMISFPDGHPLADYILEVWNGYSSDGVATGFVNADGTIDMEGLGFYAYDAVTLEALGWYDLFSQATWTPAGKSIVQQNYVLKLQNHKSKFVR